MTKAGYIYIIEDEENLCKVGVSKHHPDKRVKNLSTKFHREFTLKQFYESSDIYLDEKKLHLRLSEHHVRGEWFKISSDEICKIIELEMVDYSDSNTENKECNPIQKWTNLCLRVPNIILKELDEELEKKPWVSRNHWIVEALAEKLIKLGEK